MGITAAILGGIGGLCAVMGIVTIAELITPPPLDAQYTWTFWFFISTILLLGSIAFSLGRSQHE